MTPLFLSTSGQLPKNPFVFVWNHSRFLNCRKPFWAAIIDPNWVYNRLKNDVVGLQGEITRFAGKWSHFSAAGITRNRWFPILMWKVRKKSCFSIYQCETFRLMTMFPSVQVLKGFYLLESSMVSLVFGQRGFEIITK